MPKIVGRSSTAKFIMYTLQKYDEWKDGLPDLKWLEKSLPDRDHIDKLKSSMAVLSDKVKNFEIGKANKFFFKNKYLTILLLVLLVTK